MKNRMKKELFILSLLTALVGLISEIILLCLYGLN